MKNKRHNPNGDLLDYVDNLTECEDWCLVNVDECAAIDYVKTACYVIHPNTYSKAKLIDNQDSVHYYVEPC